LDFGQTIPMLKKIRNVRRVVDSDWNEKAFSTTFPISTW